MLLNLCYWCCFWGKDGDAKATKILYTERIAVQDGYQSVIVCQRRRKDTCYWYCWSSKIPNLVKLLVIALKTMKEEFRLLINECIHNMYIKTYSAIANAKMYNMYHGTATMLLPKCISGCYFKSMIHGCQNEGVAWCARVSILCLQGCYRQLKHNACNQWQLPIGLFLVTSLWGGHWPSKKKKELPIGLTSIDNAEWRKESIW